MTPAPESGGDGAAAPGGPASGGPPFPPQNYYNNGGNGQGSQYPVCFVYIYYSILGSTILSLNIFMIYVFL